jgi:hypothetical protein
LVEAWAHQGPAKGGQKHKVVADAFKLVFAEHLLGRTCQKVLLLSDHEAAASFQGDSWVASAFEEYGVKIRVVELSEQLRTEIRAAQDRQRR